MILPDTPSRLRRVLGIRLLMASIVVGLLAGSMAYRIQSGLIDERAQELAARITRHFESSASQVVLSNRNASKHDDLARELGRGNLIGLRVYGTAGQLAFEMLDRKARWLGQRPGRSSSYVARTWLGPSK